MVFKRISGKSQIRVILLFILSTFTLGLDWPKSEGPRTTPEEELWYRAHCLGCMIRQARKDATVPGQLKGAAVVEGKKFSYNHRISCYVASSEHIWLATESEIYQIGVRDKKVIKIIAFSEGLPISTIEDMVVDKDLLWAVTREGVFAYHIHEGRWLKEGMPKFKVGKVLPTQNEVWVVSESGTFRFDKSSREWTEYKPLPNSSAIKSLLRKGIWTDEWEMNVQPFIHKITFHRKSVWVLSYNKIYRLESGKNTWQKIASDVWDIQPDRNGIWALTTNGISYLQGNEMPIKNYTVADGILQGRLSHLEVAEQNVWVVSEPQVDEQAEVFKGGGISRFDKKEQKWFTYQRINGEKVDVVNFLGLRDGQIYVATRAYDRIETKFLHPGMQYVKKLKPHLTTFYLHRYLGNNRWESISCPEVKKKEMNIIGHRNEQKKDKVGPHCIEDVIIFKDSIFSLVKMASEKFYAAYYPTIVRFAHYDEGNKGWLGQIVDYTYQLGLQGEQPEIMALSRNHGERIFIAETYLDVLGMEIIANSPWVVTERAVAYYSDEGWVQLINLPYRFYWEVTAGVVGPKYIWFGSGMGTVSKMDKKSGNCEIIARLEGRRIEGLLLDDEGNLWVKSKPYNEGVLPCDLKIKTVVSKGVVMFDGKQWIEKKEEDFANKLKKIARVWLFKDKNYIYRYSNKSGKEQLYAYLKGAYRPKILCADGETLWLSVYGGISKIDLSGIIPKGDD